MQTPVDAPIPKVRCSPFHESMAVSPAGTAAHADAFLCVEVALPWDRDIGSHEPYRSLEENSVFADSTITWRAQGLVPLEGSDPEHRRVLAFSPSDRGAEAGSSVGPLLGREWIVATTDLYRLCRAVVADDVAELEAFSSAAVTRAADTVDLLVCTHGRRDACCGRFGTALHEAITGELAPAGQAVARADGPEVRVWRTSHTGGHRFAPTAISLPDGYTWAHLDSSGAAALVGRSGSPASIEEHNRGVSTLPPGPAQVADAAALSVVGWPWFDARRTATIVGFDRSELTTGVELAATLSDGTDLRFRATVALARHVPQPTCGAIDGPEYGVEPVWSLVSFEGLHAATTV